MKVTITTESKKILTIDELPVAKEIVKAMKEDDMSVAEYAAIAVRAFGDGCEKVYEANAEIAKNARIWNAYSDDSQKLDIWITATAKTWNGFIEIGAYLTDIWNISGENHQTEHMYADKFVRA